MLITVSGMVGSGKSTTAKCVVQLLQASGVQPHYVRFRKLDVFGGGTARSRRDAAKRRDAADHEPRGAGFRPRRLSAPLAVGYALRILAFRLSRIGRAAGCVVLDRYFYDNLIHYELEANAARVYVSVLRRLMPRPDLALLLEASNETLAGRRSNYTRTYVEVANRQYRGLPAHFPHLVIIRTDTGSSTREQLHDALRPVIARLTKTPACAPR
jgi:thymidylate kinase